MPKFKLEIRGDYPSQPSVVRLWFGRKYLIWKGKALDQMVAALSKDLYRALVPGAGKNELLDAAVRHIKYARLKHAEVEVVCQSESPKELLVCEHQLLQEATADPLCLNQSFEPYLPKWIDLRSIKAYKRAIAPKKPKKLPTTAPGPAADSEAVMASGAQEFKTMDDGR